MNEPALRSDQVISAVFHIAEKKPGRDSLKENFNV